MVFTVQLLIHNKKENFSKKLALTFFMILLLSIILSLIFAPENKTISLFLLFIFLFLIFYLLVFVKAYDFNGKITLEEDQINIQLNSEMESIYNLNEITDLVIEYNDYKGKTYYSSKPFSSAGTDNWIKFKYENKQICERLFLEYVNLNALNKLLNIWKKKDYKYMIKNYKEQSSTEISIS